MGYPPVHQTLRPERNCHQRKKSPYPTKHRLDGIRNLPTTLLGENAFRRLRLHVYSYGSVFLCKMVRDQ